MGGREARATSRDDGDDAALKLAFARPSPAVACGIRRRASGTWKSPRRRAAWLRFRRVLTRRECIAAEKGVALWQKALRARLIDVVATLLADNDARDRSIVHRTNSSLRARPPRRCYHAASAAQGATRDLRAPLRPPARASRRLVLNLQPGTAHPRRTAHAAMREPDWQQHAAAATRRAREAWEDTVSFAQHLAGRAAPFASHAAVSAAAYTATLATAQVRRCVSHVATRRPRAALRRIVCGPRRGAGHGVCVPRVKRDARRRTRAGLHQRRPRLRRRGAGLRSAGALAPRRPRV